MNSAWFVFLKYCNIFSGMFLKIFPIQNNAGEVFKKCEFKVCPEVSDLPPYFSPEVTLRHLVYDILWSSPHFIEQHSQCSFHFWKQSFNGLLCT